jgi:hypothetical protein
MKRPHAPDICGRAIFDKNRFPLFVIALQAAWKRLYHSRQL